MSLHLAHTGLSLTKIDICKLSQPDIHSYLIYKQTEHPAQVPSGLQPDPGQHSSQSELLTHKRMQLPPRHTSGATHAGEHSEHGLGEQTDPSP